MSGEKSSKIVVERVQKAEPGKQKQVVKQIWKPSFYF